MKAASELTLVCADTRCDGNKFLMIFDNKLERPTSSARSVWS